MVTTSTSVATTTLVCAVPENDVTVDVTVRVLTVVESGSADVASLCLNVSRLKW